MDAQTQTVTLSNESTVRLLRRAREYSPCESAVRFNRCDGQAQGAKRLQQQPAPKYVKQNVKPSKPPERISDAAVSYVAYS